MPKAAPCYLSDADAERIYGRHQGTEADVVCWLHKGWRIRIGRMSAVSPTYPTPFVAWAEFNHAPDRKRTIFNVEGASEDDALAKACRQIDDGKIKVE